MQQSHLPTKRLLKELAALRARVTELEQAQQTAPSWLTPGMLLESMDAAVIVMDAALRIELLNASAEKLLGWSAEQVRGQSFVMLFAQVGRWGHVRHDQLERLLHLGSGRAIVTVRRPDGAVSQVQGVFRAAYGPQQHERGVVMTFQNVAPIAQYDEPPNSSGQNLCEEAVRRADNAEQLLRSSEERYQLLVQATGAIVWGMPRSGQIETEQTAWTAFTGQSFEEQKGWGWLNAIHPDDRARTKVAWLEAVKRQSRYEIEQRVRRHDGVYCWMFVRAIPIIEAGGRLREWFGMHTDITERVQMAQELAQSQAQLAGIIDSAMDAIITVDANQRVILFNRAAETTLGCTAKEAIGQRLDRFIPDRHRKQHGENINMFGATGTTTGAIGHLQPLSALRTDGTEVPIEASISQIDIAGQKFYTVILRDITARLQAEAALRESEARLRGILDHSPAIILLKDRDGRYLMANHQFEVLLQRDAASIIGCMDTDLFPQDMALSFQEGDRIVLEGGEPFEMEEVLQREDGPHTYASVCFPLLDQNSIPYAVGRIALDITENKRLEAQFRQAQKMESIGRLAGGIAHDFNNLLTAITGYVDLAIDTLPQTHPVRDDLNEINKAADRAATLTRQLLAFARRQVIEPQILNLSTMIVDMSKLLRRLLGEDIDLTTLPDPQLWSVKADPGQIEQVVINLAVNARDAMPRGGKLLIETQNTRLDDLYTSRHIDVAPGEYVQLAVTDTGQGIPPDVQSRIFEPFFTTKEAGKGTGLGLATCYGIIKQHGGHIGFYSEEGRGTTFKIYLPRAIEGTSLRERKVEPREYASGTETVLLVEDEDMVRDMSARILRAQGYTVVEAINGVEALQLVSKHVGKTFDIVVTDVVMPRMGGEALVKQLILLQPSIKVLFVSGYTDNMLRQDDWLGPNRAILQKPFTRDALSRKVRELLDQ